MYALPPAYFCWTKGIVESEPHWERIAQFSRLLLSVMLPSSQLEMGQPPRPTISVSMDSLTMWSSSPHYSGTGHASEGLRSAAARWSLAAERLRSVCGSPSPLLRLREVSRNYPPKLGDCGNLGPKPGFGSDLIKTSISELKQTFASTPDSDTTITHSHQPRIFNSVVHCTILPSRHSSSSSSSAARVARIYRSVPCLSWPCSIANLPRVTIIFSMASFLWLRSFLPSSSSHLILFSK